MVDDVDDDDGAAEAERSAKSSSSSTAATGGGGGGCECRLAHHGSSSSSYPRSLAWLPPSTRDGGTDEGDDDDAARLVARSEEEESSESALLVYPSHGIVNVARPVHRRRRLPLPSGPVGDDDGPIMNVRETLRTSTSERRSGNGRKDGGSCGERVITCLRGVETFDLTSDAKMEGGEGSSRIVATAFSDGTVNLWTEEGASFDGDGDPTGWTETVVVGVGGGNDDDATDDEDAREVRSVTDLSGVALRSSSSDSGTTTYTTTAILVTASSAGVNLHRRPLPSSRSAVVAATTKKTISRKIASHPADSVLLTYLSRTSELLVAIGTASHRRNRIWLHTVPVVVEGGGGWTLGEPTRQGSLSGHEDWVTSLSYVALPAGWGTLASGSKDCRIRLWTFRPPVAAIVDAVDAELPDDDEEEDANSSASSATTSSDDDGDRGEILSAEAARLRISHVDSTVTHVFLEALLIGHEDAVTSVSFHPMYAQGVECLLSSGCDRSILLWSPERDDNGGEGRVVDGGGPGGTGGGGVWTPSTRMGSAGGLTGGPIGSSSSALGFVESIFDPSGTRICGHGYGGSLHFWSLETTKDNDEEATEGGGMGMETMQRWTADPCVTGHFRSVKDLVWETTSGVGKYLLSVGSDQTCRLWAEVPIVVATNDDNDDGDEEKKVWVEAGRPQVHGYDMTSIACVGGGGDKDVAGEGDDDNDNVEDREETKRRGGRGEMPHRFVSGSDEKELRAFDAPRSTLRLLRSLRMHDDDGEDDANDDWEGRAERAYLPSLGLGNKATAAGGDVVVVEDEEEDDKEKGPAYDDAIAAAPADASDAATTPRLPLERDLGIETLWPEVRKLYGHNSEIVRVVSTCDARTGPRYENGFFGKDDVLVASSAKARDVNGASIRVWNVEEGRCVDVLKGGHRSTVATLSFSPDGRYLASSGKDRRLCIWRRREEKGRRGRRQRRASAVKTNRNLAGTTLQSSSGRRPATGKGGDGDVSARGTKVDLRPTPPPMASSSSTAGAAAGSSTPPAAATSAAAKSVPPPPLTTTVSETGVSRSSSSREMTTTTTTTSSPSFALAGAVDDSHRRIVWSVHFCPLDPNLLCSGSRDGSVKVWRLTEEEEEDEEDTTTTKAADGEGPMTENDRDGDDGDGSDFRVASVRIDELYRFEPASKVGKKKKSEPVTAVSFAPKPILTPDGSETDAILSVGLESGIIEIWAVRLPGFVPGEEDDGGRTSSSTSAADAAASSVAGAEERKTGGPPASSRHPPAAPSPCRLLFVLPTDRCHFGSVTKLAWRPVRTEEGKRGTTETCATLTLASCGTDHGVRVFDLTVRSSSSPSSSSS